MSEPQPDPRKRPPDPAGTQPKVDPASLRAPTATAAAALPAGRETEPVAPSSAVHAATPAARSSAMGTGLATPLAPPATNGSTVVAPTKSAAPSKRPASARPSAHAPRFQMLFGALGALSVAAVALAIALVRAPAAAPERPWSSWHPASNGVDPAQQIAEYVAPHYRLPGGRQIVQAVGGPPNLKGQPLTIGIVHSGQAPAALEGNNVLFQLCGDGADCSIKEGKPSTERGILVAREALELALYTFRYVSGVDRVLVTMPPPPPGSTVGSSGAHRGSGSKGGAKGSGGSASSGSAGSTATAGGSQASATAIGASVATRVPRHALVFTTQDLSSQLAQPLTATLSADTPQVSQIARWPDTATVASLTNPRIYDFTVSETQQGLVMLLEPLGLGG